MRVFKYIFIVSLFFTAKLAVAASQLPGNVVNSLGVLKDVKKVEEVLQPASLLLDESIFLKLEVDGEKLEIKLVRNQSLDTTVVSWKGHLPAGRASDIKYYSGKILDKENSWVKITAKGGVYTGAIFVDGDTYFLEKKSKYFSNQGEENFEKQTVMYKSSDVDFIFSDETDDIEELLTENIAQAHDLAQGQSSSVAGTLKQVELGVVADYEYYQIYGAETVDKLKSIFHIANGVYANELGVELTLKEIVIYSDENDPFTDTTHPGNFREELKDLYQNKTMFSQDLDTAHLITGRDFETIIGAAGGIGIVCDERHSVSMSQDYTYFDNAQVMVVAHEIAHVIGATHDAEDEGYYIMRKTLSSNNTMEFSPRSKQEIESVINSAVCIGEVIGESSEFDTQVDVDQGVVITSNTISIELDNLCAPEDGKCTFSIEGTQSSNAKFKINDGDFISGPYELVRYENDYKKYIDITIQQKSLSASEAASTVTLYINGDAGSEEIIKPFTVITKEHVVICTEETESLEQHAAADRAWSETNGGTCWGTFCWGQKTNYYAKGSDVFLGNSASEVHTLHQLSDQFDTWWVGECPITGPVPPTIDSLDDPQVTIITETEERIGFKVTVTGIASDQNGDLKEVRIATQFGSELCSGAETFVCEVEVELLKTSLPLEDSITVAAVDNAGNWSQSASTGAITFDQAPDCTDHTATLDSHQSNDRVWSEISGGTCWGTFCWGQKTNYYTKGSNVLLGTSGTQSQTLHELANEPGYWYQGSCPNR